MKFFYVMLFVMILRSSVVDTNNLQSLRDKFKALLTPILSSENNGTEVSRRVGQKDSSEKKAVRSEDIIKTLQSGLAAEKLARVQLQEAVVDLKLFISNELARVEQHIVEKFANVDSQTGKLASKHHVNSEISKIKSKLQVAEEFVRDQMKDVVQLIPKSTTKCESGFIHTAYCNPFKRTCFTKRKTANFGLDFQRPPAVSFGFVSLDLGNGANTRVSITYPSEPIVTTKFLSVYYNCWHTSVCYKAGVSWMACGPVNT